jgi:alcohol dehydrogenase class IV
MNPRQHFGTGAIEELGKIVNGFSPQRILLVTGKASYEASGAAALIGKVLQDYSVTRYSPEAAYPELSNVLIGIEAYRELMPDLIMAIGGGTVIDIAKLIRICSVQQDSPSDIAVGRGTIEQPGIPLVAVPTTGGSGSEATHFAVVYVDRTKYSVAHEYVLPDAAVIDPTLTYSMDPTQTAACGLDAFSQATESFWSVNSSNESKGWAAEAVGLAFDNIEGAVHTPTEVSREAMSRAAHLAGRAINISKTTGPHALSYALAAHCGIPHGHAVALTLGSFLEFNSGVTRADINDSRGVTYVRNTLAEFCSLLGAETCLEGSTVITELMNSIGVGTRLSSFAITSESDCRNIAQSVNVQRLENNPRQITPDQLVEILMALR